MKKLLVTFLFLICTLTYAQNTETIKMTPTKTAVKKSVIDLNFKPSKDSTYISKYPNIPIIDAHTHASGNYTTIKNYLKVSDIIKEKYHSNLAYWINLDKWENPITSVDSVRIASHGRMLCSYGDYNVHIFTAKEIAQKKAQGYLGCKFWFGPYYRRMTDSLHLIKNIDDPRLAPMFKGMEESGMPMTSLHIADPNGPYTARGEWCADPVFFWEQIRALENVVNKYPKLTFVIAHGAWLNNQDAQLDYMRYLLSKYPNLNIDLAATYQYYYLLNRDNLRDFIIEYQDRIIYGTDVSNECNEDAELTAKRYSNTFRILETSQIVKEGGFFEGHEIIGLNLPKKVIEKIYYKNVLRIYSLKIENGKLINVTK